MINISKYLLTIFILLNTNLQYLYSSDLYSNFQYVDNNQVLLYKIMNWWNIDSNQNDITPCNKAIKYKRIGNIKVEYDDKSRELTLVLKNSFAKLVDILKECKNCYGPEYLENIFLNQDYFKNATTKNITKELSLLNKLIFNDVNQREAFKIKNIEKDITLIFEGVIGGLLSGSNNISVHQAGSFFRNCPIKGKKNFPIKFTIMNKSTNETLVVYSSIWGNL